MTEYLATVFGEFNSSSDFSALSQALDQLLTEDIEMEYEKMMEKCSQIFVFFDYVKDNGLHYVERLKSLVESHKRDMFIFLEGTVDLFFVNQTSVVSAFINQVEGRKSIAEEQIDGFHDMVNQLDTRKMENRIITGFNLLLPTILKQIQETFNNKLESEVTAL